MSCPTSAPYQDRLKSLVSIVGKELAFVLTRTHPSILSLDSDTLRERIAGLFLLLGSGHQGDLMGYGQQMNASMVAKDAEEYVWQILEQRGDILKVPTAELQENFSSLTAALG